MRKIFLVFFLLISAKTFAQDASINNFIVKESLLKNSKLAVIAADSLDNPKENINGAYTFTVSGFSQTLNFNDGIAIIPFKIDKSTFVYIKHENEKGTHSKLLYVYKKDGNLNPLPINSLYLIIVPLIIIILAFAFKRFIYIAIILLVIFFFFTHSSGLNISTFFDTVLDYLKNLV